VAVAAKRNIDETKIAVGRWLAGRLGADGVDITDVSLPKAGYSNETIFLTARWSDESGPRVDRLVLRVEPTGHQLFVQPDVMLQAKMLTALRQHPGTPAPRVWFTEPDPSILGAPFFIMERTEGRIPGDVPSWHAKGWTAELSPVEARRLHDEGLKALVALHSIDWRDGFEFLDRGRSGRSLAAYLEELGQIWAWAESSRQFDADVLETCYRYLIENPPDDPGEGIVWGDARMGNLMFDDDLHVVAMFDWETATIGPPGIDLGWWLMFDEFLSEAQGIPRLSGLGSRDEIVARYVELGGSPVPDIDYYELLACVVLSLVNSRLAVLLMQNQKVPEAIAAEYATRVIQMGARRLAILTQ
jgi:aminoglycoside phosphotransferase (APT) family kinase protein